MVTVLAYTMLMSPSRWLDALASEDQVAPGHVGLAV